MSRSDRLQAFANQLPDGDSQLGQFIELLQWTVVVCILAVVAALLIRKYRRDGITSVPQQSPITHVASLPVKNHFQAHLLEVSNQRFLVTTDRSGVKTVNPLTNWEDFESAVDTSQASDNAPMAAAMMEAMAS